MLWLLLTQPCTQVAALKFDAQKFVASYPLFSGSAYWAELLSEPGATPFVQAAATETALAQVLATTNEDRRLQLERHLTERIAQILRRKSANIHPQTSLTRLGFDSLLAVELRNRLDAELQITVPTYLLLADTNIETLTNYLMQRLEEHAEEQAQDEAIEEGHV